MRRLAWLLLLVGCAAPGVTPGRTGFTDAKAGGSVTIAEQPTFFPTDGPNAGAVFWNVAAGRQLFVRSDANPQVTFVVAGPLITPDTRRVVAYVTQARNVDGSTAGCTVYYDPNYVAAGVPGQYLNARVWAHELGHCLELAGHQSCDQFGGVMSACFFWERVLAGWGPTADDTIQLRAAGYIP